MKYLKLLFLLAVTLLILIVNFNLYRSPDSNLEVKEDITKQLNFLESELKQNFLGDRMQDIFPEGYVFVNVLYGLAWCELAMSDRKDKALQQRAIQEALYAYREIDSDQGKQSFDVTLKPEYGIFYRGWKNYLLSKILMVDTLFEDSELYIQAYQTECNQLKKAYANTSTPYLQSYHFKTWPADNFLAIASLSNHDKLFEPKYQPAITNWLKKIKQHLDPETQMLPHEVSAGKGKVLEGARGCSISLMLRLLAEIDGDFASEQYKLLKSSFIDTTFGLPSLREYPQGKSGWGDIDSGPVIFGVGFSGTIVMIGTLAMFEDRLLSEQQYQTVYAFGGVQENESEIKFLWEALPMADAFIAWGRASGLHYTGSDTVEGSSFWAVLFLIYSFVFLGIIWTMFFGGDILKVLLHKSSNN